MVRAMRGLHLLALAPLPVAALVFACGGGASSQAPPSGPDAGAGCDSAIHAHCTFSAGFDAPLLGNDVCVEYSGASEGDPSCPAPANFTPHGQYATGPCSRSAYDKSCVLGGPDPDAGGCRAYATIWSDSTEWSPDAGIIGFLPCLSQ
jgi:hypothetical protein